MTRELPRYCALCGASCETALIDSEPSAPPNPATPGAFETDSSSIDTSWTRQWHVTKLFKGRSEPAAGDDGMPSGRSAGLLGGQIPQRQVPIHTYCLTVVLNLTRDSKEAQKVSALGLDMLIYRLHLHTGWAPWSERQPEAERFHCAPATSQLVYWRGTSTQRERWSGQPGSHLLPRDLISPLLVGQPSRRHWATGPRPPQKSVMANLPSHIHTEIMLHLLRLKDTDLILPPAESTQQVQQYMLPSLGVDLVLALSDSCMSSDPPASLWRIMILDDLHKLKLLLLRGWRGADGPGKATLAIGGAWEAMDEAFSRPVEKAMQQARLHSSVGVHEAKACAGWDMRDVWDWWKYGEGWRSRRRVWYCVVYACSTARYAPWW